MIFRSFIVLMIISLVLYAVYDTRKRRSINNDLDYTFNFANSRIEGIYKEIDELKDIFKNKVLMHGDKITLRSTAHQKHRLQDNGNKLAKFENANRGGWEQLIVEKCGLPGINDNQKCW